MPDIHDQALEWAQANPKDPRAQDVMAKAWAEKNPGDPRSDKIRQKLESKGIAVNSAEHPDSTDLFSDTDRMKAGFADDAHLPGLVAPKPLPIPYASAHKNAQGDLVTQDKPGHWVKDQDNFFPSWETFKHAAQNPTDLGAVSRAYDTSHPVHWLERHLGGALPTAGMAIGGAMGAPSGPGAIAGAGLLGGAGESLRLALGKMLGVHGVGVDEPQKGPESLADSEPVQDLGDVAKEGLSSAAYELGGKAVGAVPISKVPVINKLGKTLGDVPGTLFDNLVRKPTAGISSVMTGVPYEDVLQLMRDPVGNATAPALDEVASTAQMELKNRQKQLGVPVEEANDAHLAARGTEHQDVSGATHPTRERLATANVSQGGSGRLSKDQLKEMEGFLNQEFNNPQTVAPEVRASEISYGRPHDEPFSPPDRVIPGKEVVVEPETKVNADFPTLRSLKATIDGIDAKISAWYDSNPFAKSTPPEIQELKLLRNSLKEAYTSKGATGAAVRTADAPYSQFMDDANLLKGLNSDATQESVSKGLFGPTKSNARKAAERQIPEAMNDLRNWHSAEAYGNAGFFGAPGANRNLHLALMGIAGGAAGAATRHTPEALMSAIAAGTVTSPMLHRLGLGVGSLGANVGVDQFWSLLAKEQASKYHLLEDEK